VVTSVGCDEAVIAVVRAIPRGALCSYGDVAETLGLLGVPCGPRQVARALRERGGLPGIPWWRVVQSAGTVAPQVLASAAPLLAYDGIEVRSGRVPLQRCRWRPGPGEVAEIGQWLTRDAATGARG
jgi:alkylated DNA nucleotide flippase Atl1